MAKTVLIPLPSRDFDPTEAAVPWRILRSGGIQVIFATPDGKRAHADPRMLTGQGLGIWSGILRADQSGREAYAEMERAPEFAQPMSWPSAPTCDALLLPGGHAPGMREYLESSQLQARIRGHQGPLAAICHGVVLAARAGVLKNLRTTALLKSQELTAWAMTALWLGSYYRTYPETVEAEVRRSSQEFVRGPMPLSRDTLEKPGFTVRDGRYLSARWPGDAHGFALGLLDLISALRSS